jgi:hypothetical protein
MELLWLRLATVERSGQEVSAIMQHVIDVPQYSFVTASLKLLS